MRYHDPAEDPRASYSRHPVDDLEPEAEVPTNPEKRFMDLLDHLFVTILSPSKYRERDLSILVLATRIGLRDGVTAADLARHYGVTRAAISKIQVRMLRQLGLPPSILMRAPDSRQKFIVSNVHPIPSAVKL